MQELIIAIIVLMIILSVCLGVIIDLISQCKKLKKEIDNISLMSMTLNGGITSEKVDIETISTQVSVPLYELSIIGNYEIPEKVAHLISETFIFELAHRHLISYESSQSFTPDEKVFRATIQVVKPKF